ncbi:FAD-dependent oxidoreductase [Streptomyces abikoensis]|uniref:FAD-dependent oxidoreductase n=1 Tax=Streptomyces abikoensis TaxID=97398 RepID=UPI0036BE986D
MSDVDAVVIGAGNAGLTAAATLQRAGVRTLLVERHNVPGGCATSFRRGRYEFEVALHQLSGVGFEGQDFTLRGLCDRCCFCCELRCSPALRHTRASTQRAHVGARPRTPLLARLDLRLAWEPGPIVSGG